MGWKEHVPETTGPQTDHYTPVTAVCIFIFALHTERHNRHICSVNNTVVSLVSEFLAVL